MLFGPDALSVGRAVAPVEIARGTIFLLSFTGFTEATSVSDGRFKLIFPHGMEVFTISAFLFSGAFSHFIEAFPTKSVFLLFEATVKASEPGTGRGP
jgi:hypothetical protein